MNDLRKETEELMEKIGRVLKEDSPSSKLPQNTFYIDDDHILALPRKKGESRFPYDSDGLVVWAHSTGYIDACESAFTIFKTAFFGEDSPVAFFGGIKDGSGYIPVSITGPGAQLDEKIQARYVVFGMRDVYYITDTAEMTFTVRMHVDSEKHIHFRQCAYSKSDKPVDIYLMSFFEALLRYGESESFWSRMSKFAVSSENCMTLMSRNDSSTDTLSIKSMYDEKYFQSRSLTCARSDFLGTSGRTIANAACLKTGTFGRQQPSCAVADLPVASQIYDFSLPPKAETCIEYELIYAHDSEGRENAVNYVIDTARTDSELAADIKKEDSYLSNLEVVFEGWNDGSLDSKVMNRFYRDLQRQTEFCALGKNYAGPALGIRDVFQQLEGALMWKPETAREKMSYAMNFIFSNGKSPRQVTIPTIDDSFVHFDPHEYIDQGNWIISAFYTYLAHTDDFSILDDVRSYYDIMPGDWCHKSALSDTILDHLVRITDYLISNIDPETNCLRVLFGDWNDALDGLGKTDDKDKEFGSGVTVMATLSLYRNLQEMSEILEKVGKYPQKAREYREIRTKVGEGMLKYCVDMNEKGERRIIHGWGDKRLYKVGSFNDPDGKSRFSTTSNAVWGYSDIMRKDPGLKESILECFRAVDSKYGFKTFDVPFPRDSQKYVGRIATITPGTYENSCAYVHCSIFAICALFAVGEPEKAWQELEKSIVITHRNCSMTSFVMPNSYVENKDWSMDGESMGDWYTGSGATVVKGIVKYGFGIRPDLNGLTIELPSVMPSKSAHLKIKIKGVPFVISYSDRHSPSRSFSVNGSVVKGTFDDLRKTEKIYLDSDMIKNCSSVSIDITD